MLVRRCRSTDSELGIDGSQIQMDNTKGGQLVGGIRGLTIRNPILTHTRAPLPFQLALLILVPISLQLQLALLLPLDTYPPR